MVINICSYYNVLLLTLFFSLPPLFSVLVEVIFCFHKS